MNFKDTIKAARNTKKLSQEAIAEHLKVSQSAYQKWESGKGEPDDNNIANLAEILGLDCEELKHLSNTQNRERRVKIATERARKLAGSIPVVSVSHETPGNTSKEALSMSIAGLSDLQKACLKRACALMLDNRLDDDACLDLLLSWKN